MERILERNLDNTYDMAWPTRNCFELPPEYPKNLGCSLTIIEWHAADITEHNTTSAEEENILANH